MIGFNSWACLSMFSRLFQAPKVRYKNKKEEKFNPSLWCLYNSYPSIRVIPIDPNTALSRLWNNFVFLFSGLFSKTSPSKSELKYRQIVYVTSDNQRNLGIIPSDILEKSKAKSLMSPEESLKPGLIEDNGIMDSNQSSYTKFKMVEPPECYHPEERHFFYEGYTKSKNITDLEKSIQKRVVILSSKPLTNSSTSFSSSNEVRPLPDAKPTYYNFLGERKYADHLTRAVESIKKIEKWEKLYKIALYTHLGNRALREYDLSVEVTKPNSFSKSPSQKWKKDSQNSIPPNSQSLSEFLLNSDATAQIVRSNSQDSMPSSVVKFEEPTNPNINTQKIESKIHQAPFDSNRNLVAIETGLSQLYDRIKKNFQYLFSRRPQLRDPYQNQNSIPPNSQSLSEFSLNSDATARIVRSNSQDSTLTSLLEFEEPVNPPELADHMDDSLNVEKLSTKRVSLDLEITKKLIERQNLEQEMKQISAENSILNTKLNQIQESMSALEKIKKSLADELKASLENLSKKTEEFQALKQNWETMLQELSEKNLFLDKKLKEAGHQIRDLEKLKPENEILSTEIQVLKNQLKEQEKLSKEKIEPLERALHEKEGEIQDLNKKIIDLEFVFNKTSSMSITEHEDQEERVSISSQLNEDSMSTRSHSISSSTDELLRELLSLVSKNENTTNSNDTETLLQSLREMIERLSHENLGLKKKKNRNLLQRTHHYLNKHVLRNKKDKSQS